MSYDCYNNVCLNECFSSKDSLKAAISDYMFDSTSSSMVTIKYGYSIYAWCVRNIRDMSSLFEGAADFNKDIGDWDVSIVVDMNQDIGR